MNVDVIERERTRRTAADDVFDHLRGQIVSMALPPGARLSEADVARDCNVSRQPVREAFIRLGNMNLLLVRPQRATVVRPISRTEILESRFIRMAVEMEIVRRACKVGSGAYKAAFEDNLTRQDVAVRGGDADSFNDLDYEFHRLICLSANCGFAYKTIAENKISVERLCMLSLTDMQEQVDVYEDHLTMYDRLTARDEEAMIEITKRHLSRLNTTLDHVQANYPDYFEA
ncbi:MAG: GntR family transcriptional regulator [Pseudomonadota bacterium]